MLADSGLSPGRRRVAELMLIGLSAEEIAIELRLSYHTVRGYE
jgi:DNA-binding CsgD family transcriptional regulator